MANLKVDLINQITNEKYYEEIEFIRLAQEPNVKYKDKLDQMAENLRKIAVINAQIGLVEQYLPEPAPAAAPAPQAPAPEAPAAVAPAPEGKVHKGQSHGEG